LLVLDGSGPSGAGPDGIGLGCDPGDFAGASGKIVVTQRGVCARIDRATNGQAAGAVAVIMVNNAAGLPPLDGDYPGLTIPFIGIGDEHANDLKTRNGQNATLTAAGVIANPNYQTLADFSSGGPRQGDSALKPDVTAPGVSVYSTSIGTGTGGTYISGTSMASPHTAGVAALVVKNHPTWSAAQVRAAIMNNANPNLVTNADVMQAGAGVVDALDAINTRVVAMTENDGASLSYGYQMLSGAFTSTKTITLTNFGNTAATYNLTTSKQDSLSYALVTAPASQVTVPAASGGNPGHATVNVKISLSKAQVAQLPFADDTSPSAANDIQFRSPHGAITFAPTGSGTSLRVPFLLVPRATSTIVPTPSGQNLSLKNNGVHTGFADLLAWTYNDPADVPGEPVDIRAMGAMVLGPSNMGLAQGDRSIFFAVNTWNRWSSPGGDVEFDIGIDTGGSPAPDFFVFGYDGGQLFDDAYDGQYLSIIVTPSGHFVDAWTTDAPLNGSTLILPVAASDLGLTKNGVNQFSISNLNGFSLTNNAVDHVNVPGGGAAVIRPWAPPLAQGFSAQLTPGQTTSTLLKFQQQAKNDHLLGWMVISMDDANGAPQADTIRFPT
jgi:hypothetical protein